MHLRRPYLSALIANGLALAVTGALLVGLTAPAHAATSNGPVWTGGSSLQPINSTSVADIGFGATQPDQVRAPFSPDGARIFDPVVTIGSPDRTAIRIRRNTAPAAPVHLTTIDGFVESPSWSSDGRRVAYLLLTGDPENPGGNKLLHLEVIDTQTGAVTRLLSSNADFRLENAGVAWRPGTPTITVIGSEPDADGNFNSSDAFQVYAVDAGGAAVTVPARWNEHHPPIELGGSEPFEIWHYRHPHWSPTGSTLTAALDHRTIQEGDTLQQREAIASIGQGALLPHLIATIYAGGPVSGAAPLQAFYGYSPDGASLVISADGGPSQFELVNATTGARTPTQLYGFGSWQPCPDGRCAPWASAPDLGPVTADGRRQVGGTVEAQLSSWGDGALAYQWLRDGAPIAGATRASYRIVAADAGRLLTVRVTLTRPLSPAAVRTSPALRIGAHVAKKPTLSGKKRPGKKLKVKNGTWAAPGYSFKRQWLRNGKPIKGATKGSYKLKKADRGKKVSVRIAATRGGWPTVKASTKAVKIKRR